MGGAMGARIFGHPMIGEARAPIAFDRPSA
jgi:hypothetical protein